MAKFELSLSPDYVPSWTVIDAVRELFQNALDQQVTVEGNEMFFEFEQLTNDSLMEQPPGTLRIGNKLSVLSAKTLLLGSSSKADDPNTIGQFGEGYKVAVLVLLRSGKKVTFYNYGAREVWTTRFKQSKKYGGRILEFDIDKKFIWQKVPDNNLTIEVEGITAEEYNSIVESNLHLQEVGDKFETPLGDILFDEKHKGKVFVNGLFVCDYEPYTHGYNFKPKHLKLDRDRKMADSFELRWKASNMWAVSNNDIVQDLIKEGAADVAFLSSYMKAENSWIYGTKQSIADSAVDCFIKEHGAKAVPVSTNDEMKLVKDSGAAPVLVKPEHHEVLKASPRYYSVAAPIKPKVPTRDQLEIWLIAHQQSLSKKAIHQLTHIIEECES